MCIVNCYVIKIKDPAQLHPPGGYMYEGVNVYQYFYICVKGYFWGNFGKSVVCSQVDCMLSLISY